MERPNVPVDTSKVRETIAEGALGKPLSLANLLLGGLSYLKSQETGGGVISEFNVGRGKRPEGVVFQGDKFSAQFGRREEPLGNKVRLISVITIEPCASNFDYPRLTVEFAGKPRKKNSAPDLVLPIAFRTTDRGQIFYFAEALEKRAGLVLTGRFFALEVWDCLLYTSPSPRD